MAMLPMDARGRPSPGGLVGRLHERDDAAWLADLLIDLEDEIGDIVGCASQVAKAPPAGRMLSTASAVDSGGTPPDSSARDCGRTALRPEGPR